MEQNKSKWDKYSYNLIDFVYGDVTQPICIDEPIDYIVHGSSITVSKTMVDDPAMTTNIIVDGTRIVLELARKHNVGGMVFLSSMEVYGTVSEGMNPVK